MKNESVWNRLSQAVKNNLPLTVIVVAAVLLELTMGVMYYSAQNIIQNIMERLVEREMNAIYLCIQNKLSKVEVTVDNMAWVVSESLDDPDWMYDTAQQMVKHNPSFWGSGVAFVPYYYPNKGKFFEPYAVRRGDSIVSMQIGSDGTDHTQKEYFRVAVTLGKAHWSEPYVDIVGAKTVITTYSVPVRDSQNRIAGVVFVDITLGWLNEVMEESKQYKSTQRFLVTSKGHRLAGEDNTTLETALRRMKTDGDMQSYFTCEDDKGEKQHVFIHPVGGMTDWVLITALNHREVFGRLNMVRMTLLLLILAGLLLIGFIVWRTSRNLERLHKVNAEKERIGSELRVASQIQQSMLPHHHHHQDDVDIYGSLVPAREVGGDLYDYFVRDEKLFFCIGDVSGKGAPSAMVMAVTHSLFRSASAHESNPAHIMQTINETSCQGNDSNMFVTLFIGVLDLPTGRLRYCNAGHDAPFIMVNGQWSMVNVIPHLPVGVFGDFVYIMQETQIAAESTLFLYTDGLTEAKNNEHKQFGLERMEKALATCTGLTPKGILERITEAVHAFVKDGEQSDDLTLLAIRYTPKNYESTLTETLMLRNDVHEVSRFSAFIKSVMEKLNIERSLARRLQLAVEEAVVNVIDYAYPAGKEGEIEIRIMSDGKTLKTIIIDSGVAFDPTAKEKADTSLSAEDRQIGGLGILLVRELMDTINYERENGRNILTLIKKLV